MVKTPEGRNEQFNLFESMCRPVETGNNFYIPSLLPECTV